MRCGMKNSLNDTVSIVMSLRMKNSLNDNLNRDMHKNDTFVNKNVNFNIRYANVIFVKHKM